jgi:enoyl-CoA hydratase/carnithine racemase
MTPELLDAFRDAALEAARDEDVRAVVVTGKGSAFSTGADFRSVLQRGEEGGRPRAPHEKSYAMYVPFLTVLDIEVPVVAALNGHAVGGGFGLALACDLRIASRDAKYGANFARVGLHPGMAISYLLPRLVGPARAAELLFTGRLVDGREAEALGIVNRAVAPEDVLPEAMAFAGTIAKNAPLAVRMMKRTFYEGLGWDVRGGALREAFAQAVTVETEDCKEGMAALLEKREPDFTGR